MGYLFPPYFNDVKPFDWLMFVVELLVLLLISYEVCIGWVHRSSHKRRISKLFSAMQRGQALQIEVPSNAASDDQISEWCRLVMQWAEETNKIMMEISPQASAAFLHERGDFALHYNDIAKKSHDHYVFLIKRINNVRAIMEKPDVYL